MHAETIWIGAEKQSMLGEDWDAIFESLFNLAGELVAINLDQKNCEIRNFGSWYENFCCMGLRKLREKDVVNGQVLCFFEDDQMASLIIFFL